MKASELHKKSVTELQEELLGLLKEQFNLRMQAGGGQGPRPHQFGQVRKSIARVKTIIKQKNIAGEA